MKLALFVASILPLFGYASAQSGAWGQCGGTGWTGATTCISGYVCTYSNPYYSQCLPVSSSSSTTTTSSHSSTTSSMSGTSKTTATSTTSIGTTSTTTSTSASATGSQIRTVQDPVYHFYLQNVGGVPVLGPESSSGYFTLGSTISLNNSNGSKLYLNLNTTVTTSYQPLILGSTATTTDWGLEGDTIVTTSPRQLNFIACSTSDATIYNVYLQNGNDTPSGVTCTLVTLHLPCLC